MSGNTEQLWNVTDVARFLDVPISAVYKMTSRNTIPYIKLGGRLRFRRADVERWLDVWSVSPLARLEAAKRQAERIGIGGRDDAP